MRYVKSIDERFYNEMIKEIQESFENLAMKFSSYCPGMTVSPIPSKEKGQSYPFPLALQLRHVYDYLIGEGPIPDHMAETTQELAELFWHNPFLANSTYQISWQDWEKTKTGFLVRCAYIAISLECDQPVNSKQLSIISGVTAPAVIKAIKAGRIRGKKEDREWIIPAEDAMQYINEVALKV